MKVSHSPENVRKAILVFFLVFSQCFAEGKFPVCSESKEGNQTLYRKASGLNDGIIACIKNNGQYAWKFLDGSSTLGEEMNPAKDCSDIVDNLPEAKDGFYWLTLGKGNPLKAWCDTHTDGGGFLLVGMKNNSVTWNVSTNGNLVDPLGPPHWSIMFADVNIRDFAIQISTTENFEDTKAHWSYKLKTHRAFGDLFDVGKGGCTDIHSGIGSVSYVKDLLSGEVVTTNFKCSKFGPHVENSLGWGRMKYCLRNECPVGYAFIKGLPNFKLDSHGSFSFSANSEYSGITHNATAFVGCDSGQCCACFGPKGGKKHYCGRKCQALNGGTVLTGQVYVWYWIRTRLPQRVYKRCMEFKMKTQAGKLETHFIDKKTGTAHKGTCSKQFQTLLNEGTLTVENKESFDNLPSVPGMISYREDNEKLYVNKGNKWSAIGSENETQSLELYTKKKIAKMEAENQDLKARLVNIESRVPQIGRWPSGRYCILANGNCPSGFRRYSGYMTIIKVYSEAPFYLKPVYFGSSRLTCHHICGGTHGDLYIAACCK